VCVCVSACVSLSESLVSLQLSLSYNGEQNKFRGKGRLGGFLTTNFSFAIFCLGFPTLIMPFEERASLSLDVPHYTLALLRAFCEVSRRNRTRLVYILRA
jgi:hypothetical protein